LEASRRHIAADARLRDIGNMTDLFGHVRPCVPIEKALGKVERTTP
jgi:hypothetical protein